MANTWLSVNKRRIDYALMLIETLNLKGGFDEVRLNDFKYIIKGMEQEINNLTKDLDLLKEENQRLIELFKTDKED